MAGDMQGELMAEEAHGRPAPDAASAERSERTMLLVVLAAAAGLIHAKAFIDHAPHYWLFGVFFGVLAYAQVAWAFVVYRRPGSGAGSCRPPSSASPSWPCGS